MGLLSFFFGSCSKQPAPPVAVSQPVSKFHPGQVWAFKPPADQPNAKLIILRVEDGGKIGTVVHIALSDVSYGDGLKGIQHLPFAESAVEQSVTTLEQETSPLPDFADGYRQWRAAFDAGKAGVFNIPVAEAFEAVTSAYRNRK